MQNDANHDQKEGDFYFKCFIIVLLIFAVTVTLTSLDAYTQRHRANARANDVTYLTHFNIALINCINNRQGYTRDMILGQCVDDYFQMKGWALP